MYKDLAKAHCLKNEGTDIPTHISIDGQVRSVRLQTDTFSLFPRQQTDK